MLGPVTRANRFRRTSSRLTSPLASLGVAAALTMSAAAAPAFADSHDAEGAEVDQLAVVVVGDGTTYENAAGPVAVQWVDSTGELGQEANLPSTEQEADAGHRILTLNTDRDQAGALQQSADHDYVTLGGYDAPLGEDGNGSVAPDTLRVIGRVDSAGEVDTSTTLAGAYSERHIRGVASTDGERYWTGGHGNDSSDPARAGVLTIERGGDTPEVIATDGGSANRANNTRVPVIHEGQLYVSSDRTGLHGINAVGDGVPTSETELNLIAPAPGGSTVPHDFAFVGDSLYVTYTEGAAAIVRYELDGEQWEPSGQFAGSFWGLTGRVAGEDEVLYATRGSNAGNELVQIVTDPEQDFADSTASVVATAEPNTAFRGVAFAPGFTPGDGPVATPEAAPEVSWDVRVAGGAGNALSAVLGAPTNPAATGTFTDPDGDDVELTVASNDTDVVANDDIEVTISGDGTFTLQATPSGVGTTTIDLTATTSDGRSGSSSLAYWVSEPIPDESALAHVGMADASAAYDVGDGYTVVADDDSNQLRLFAPTFGEPVAEFDFTDVIDHVTDRTFDLEGAARVDNTIYWVGSLGNSRSGNYWPHRDIVFATDVIGSGAQTELEYVGAATGFRDALVEWDNADGHGAGAGALQFERATTPGYSVEGPNSLNVEGAAIAPDGTTLWLGFRSPLVPVADDLGSDPAGDQALIIGIENIADVVATESDVQPASLASSNQVLASGGDIAVGDYITLDLDGRAIRDITEVDDGGGYLIAAGSADDAGNFAIYGWSGDPQDAPVPSNDDLGLDGWTGSYEAFGVAPSLTDGTTIRVMQDVGTLDIYQTGTEAQDLTREHMKFVSHDYVVDFDGAFTQDSSPPDDDEDGTGEDGSGEDGSGEDGSGEDGTDEDGAGEDGAGEDDGDAADGGGTDGAGTDGGTDSGGTDSDGGNTEGAPGDQSSGPDRDAGTDEMPSTGLGGAALLVAMTVVAVLAGLALVAGSAMRRSGPRKTTT